MEVIVVLLILAYLIFIWRLICRWWVNRGGKRWVGHAFGSVLGNFLCLAVAIPMIPAPEEKPTVGGVIYGLIVLGVFIFLEYRPKAGGRADLGEAESEQKPSAGAEQNEVPQKTDPTTHAGLTFSLKETAEMILADDVVDQREAELLLQMLDKQDIVKFDPACRELHQVLIASLDDGVLDNDEAEEIKVLLSEICDRPIERAEKPVAKESVRARRRKAKAEKALLSQKAAPKKAHKQPVRSARPGDILGFMYTDSKGNTSDREINFRSASLKSGIVYLKGICQDRNAFRTFRADRMEILCFADTGELIDDLSRTLR